MNAIGPVLDSLVAGFPHLLFHLFVTLALFALAVWIYWKVTPHDEMRLIREGNVAAAVSCAGAMLGLALPLALCLASSIIAMEILLWGAVTLVIQLVVFRLADWAVTDLTARIERGELSTAILLAGIKISVGAINAAAVSG